MSHPSSIDLEAFATGEVLASVAGHIGGCAACAAFVERIRDAAQTQSPERAAAVVARAALREAPPPAASSRKPTWIFRAATVAVPLAAAAAVLLVLQRRPAGDGVTSPIAPPAETPTSEPSAASVSFKGSLQAAVIRERSGAQERFTDRVGVRPGDRLRVEVALDREEAVCAAVLGDDASWLELMSEATRSPGTHFSERAARVDDTPLRGTILVGAPAAMSRARASKKTDGLTAIPIEWEGAAE